MAENEMNDIAEIMDETGIPSSLQGSMVTKIAPANESMNSENTKFVPKEYIQSQEELSELETIQKEEKERKKKGFPKALIYLFASLIFAFSVIIAVAVASDVFSVLSEKGKFSFPIFDHDDESSATPSQKEDGTYASLTELAKVVRKSCVTVLFSSYNEIAQETIGSGVIIGEEGDMLYILTCGHIVDGIRNISVRFDGESNNTQAFVRGYDPDTDLGIIYVYKSQINEATLKTIKIATLGNSDNLKEGETVMAVATPVNSTFANSISVGVISCALREITLVNAENVGTTYNMIQTDCAINPGASGGGLFNGRGELVGICNATLVDVDSEGIFFATPVTPNKEIITSVINIGKYVRPYLAITGTDAVNWNYAEDFNITKGVYVVSVVEDGPADHAGLREGDIIVSFDGIELETMDQLKELVLLGSVDSAVTLEVLRLNQTADGLDRLTLFLTLGDKTNYYN